VKYSTATLTEVGRTPVGEDPHVTLHPTDNRIFVACQETDNVFVIDRTTMIESNEIPLLGGHGVWIPPQGQTLYVTNFPSHVTGGAPGPGANGLFSVDLGTETESGSLATAPQPHNLVSTPDGNKLYLTHSNSAELVTVFDISNPDGLPRNPSSITVGNVPFGIAFMP
jgi:DNA-binding beta-propeller fold protein YncE